EPPCIARQPRCKWNLCQTFIVSFAHRTIPLISPKHRLVVDARSASWMRENEMSDEGSVDYKMRDGRAYVTLNRPSKKNAMSDAMWDQLMVAYDRAEADDDVRVVILTGAGDDFCAGHDLSEVGNQYKDPVPVEEGRKPRRPSQRTRLK